MSGGAAILTFFEILRILNQDPESGCNKSAVPDSGYSEGGDKVSVVTRNRFGP